MAEVKQEGGRKGVGWKGCGSHEGSSQTGGRVDGDGVLLLQ